MSISADPLDPIRQAFKAGNRKAAQRGLRLLLRNQPSADAWVLAAQSCGSNDEAIYCLQQALRLQPQHSLAQRLLLKLESAPSAALLPTDLSAETIAPSSSKRSIRRRIILVSVLLVLAVVSILTLNLAGLITGPVTVVTQLTGGTSPVREINGQPLSQIENAAALIQPSQTRPLKTQDIDVIEPGYAHDFTFAADEGSDIAVYVQFLSVAAKRVSRNVILMRPDGSDATPICERDAILEGDNGVTLTCKIDIDGTWIIRVLGRDQESVGAYFIGEQMLQ